MKLYYSPGACSLACHIALEESGLGYEVEEFNTRRGETHSAEYLRINPLGKVPALLLDNREVLTEGLAIMNHVADLVPEARLLPAWSSIGRARALEWMGYLASTVHIAFRPLLRPGRLIGDDPADIEKVRRFGVTVLRATLDGLDRRLEGRRYSLGEHYTLCDGYLLVYWLWTWRNNLDQVLPRYSNIDRIAAAVVARPAVQRVLQNEHISIPGR